MPSSSPPPPEPVTRLVLAIFRAHQALVNAGDLQVAPLGLNSARWKAMGAISIAGHPLTAPAIGQRMGLSRQGAQKQLDGLVRDGLAQRLDNPAHRRSSLYALTPDGHRVFEQAQAIWSQWGQRLAAGWDHETIGETTTLLEKLAQRAEST